MSGLVDTAEDMIVEAGGSLRQINVSECNAGQSARFVSRGLLKAGLPSRWDWRLAHRTTGRLMTHLVTLLASRGGCELNE